MLDLNKKNDFLYLTLQHSQEMINFADSKANIFITIQSLLITIGIAGALISETFTILKSGIGIFWLILYVFFLIIFIVLSLIGITFAIDVIQPRGPKENSEREREGVFYYGHIASYPNSESYFNKINIMENNALTIEYCSQIFQLATIAKIKMKIVNKATKWLRINIIATIFILFCTVIIHAIWGGG